MNSESMGTGVMGGSAPAGASGSGKVRIYDLAKELGLPNAEMVSKIRTLGIEAKNYMSTLEGTDVERVKRALAKERLDNVVQEKANEGGTVLRRRTKDGSAVRAPAPMPPPAREEKPAKAAPVEARPAAPPPERVETPSRN